MKFVTVSDLRNGATQIISALEETKEEVVITKKGRPVALLKFITEDIFTIKDDLKGD